MDHKELGTNSAVSTSASDGSTKFASNSATVQPSRNKTYDSGSSSSGKMDVATARPCAIIGPDRVLPPNPSDNTYLKKMPSEAWPPSENVYRRPPDYPTKTSDYQPTRNISPRQTFQENMQRIMVPPTFSSMKNNEESTLKHSKLNMPVQAKYCDVPYNVNSVNSEHKNVRNADIPMSNVNSPYARSMPPPYDWSTGVNMRPLRPYGAPEFYQYQEFSSCAGPRPMAMARPHRPLHEDTAQVYSHRLYQDANIRFKPYPAGKEKHPQPRYDHISNFPSTFHPPASIPPHKYDLQRTVHGHPYPVYPSVPFNYIDRRIHDPFVEGYQRHHSQQASFNSFHNQGVPPPYGPIPGNCIQNKTYSDASSKPMHSNKIQFENNNKVYLNLESRNKYSAPENVFYNEINHSQALRGDILLPTHSTLNIHPMSHHSHSIYRKDNTPIKPYDYNNPNYRIFDQSINLSPSLQRLPLQFSPNSVAISPSDSNTSNDTAHTIGTSQEDCGYVSQSSTASIRSLDSGNIQLPHNIYRRHGYNNYDMVRNTFHLHGPTPLPTKKTSSSNKKNLDVRQFLQMWNEGDEEVSESNKEATTQNHLKKHSQSEVTNNQEQLYVLGLVNVPSEELAKYDHIQKISKLPENIKGYNNLEILHQYEELVETPHVSNHNKLREYHPISKTQFDKEIITKLPRPVSPLDVEAKISQSIIHKEVGCNFEIKPCSPQMLNVEIAAPMQNILGERMIEKVINPNLSNPPLNRSDNKKSQNVLNDTVKGASCKMVNDQYASRSSPHRTKTNTYSMQDLESNAGLCYTSLPQLDNDIELSFPEINQQFIKANNLESNVTPGLQNVSHMDFEQTHCLPHENKNDNQQHNPQLPSSPVVDKELSKLSKYRKGRKSEHNSQNIEKLDTIKSGESMATLQRVDSVIIKNPDTNKSNENDYHKLNIELKYENQKNHEQYYSSSKYENNMEKYGFSSETAIDFSLNRSEDETAVSYLSEIDESINHNLPPLEEFNEELNGGENISFSCNSIEELNVSAKPVIMSSAVVAPKSENSKCRTSDNNEKNDQILSIEVNENQISPKDSDVNEDYNVLVMRKLATTEPDIPAIRNIESADDSKNKESLALDIKTIQNTCASSDETLFTISKDTLQSNKLDVEIGNESINKSNENELSSSVQYTLGMKSETESVAEDLFVMKNWNFENKLNTIEDVLEDLSNHNIHNFNTKNNFSNNTSKIDVIHVVDSSKRQNKAVVEDATYVSPSNKEVPDFKIKGSEENCLNICQLITTESNVNDKIPISTGHLEDFEKSSIKSPVMLSSSEDISYVKNETNVVELPVQIVKLSSEIKIKSTEEPPKKVNETKMDISLDKNVTNNCNDSISTSAVSFSVSEDTKMKLAENNVGMKTEELSKNDNETKMDVSLHKNVTNSDSISTSAESFSVAEDSNVELAENNLGIMDTSEVQFLSNNASENVCNDNNETGLLMNDETESYICDDLRLETRQRIDKLTERIQKTYEEEKVEEITTTSNDELVKPKQELEELTEMIQKTYEEEKVEEITTTSNDELVKPKQELEELTEMIQKTYEEEKVEEITTTSNDELVKPKQELEELTEMIQKTYEEEKVEEITTTSNDELVKPQQELEELTERIQKIYEEEKVKEITTTSNDELVKPKKGLEELTEKIQNSSCMSVDGTNISIMKESSSIKTDIRGKSCLPNETSPKFPVEEISEMETDMVLETINENPCSVSNKSFVNSNAIEETCLSNNKEASFENTSKYAETKHEININQTFFERNIEVLESELLMAKACKNSIELAVEVFGSNIKKTEENLSVNSSECKELTKKITKMDVAIADSECMSDVPSNYNGEESFINITSENSVVDPVECEILKRDNHNITAGSSPTLESDMNNQSRIKVGIEYNITSSSEETKSLNIDNKCLQSWTYPNYSKGQNEVVTTKKHDMICRKELFSPWMQNLWMFTEGTCDVIFNKTNVVEDSCSKTVNSPLKDQNVNEILFKNYESELLESKNNEINCESVDIDNLNASSPVANSRPRKKRSLSESALESYKDNFVQPRKRKKGIQENHSILESSLISEDICNIIQTNRRNSISTFYNEDNVYIVIDNDLILTEENNETNNLCYTENNEEYLASMTPTNCGINFNVETDSCTEEPSEMFEYSDTLQHLEENFMDDPWVDDVACMETVFSEDVAENIIIDIQASPKRVNSIDVESVDEDATVFYESDHIDKIKSIYGRNLCYDNTKLIETLYRTPQMNVNKTLYNNESPHNKDPIESLDSIDESCLESNEQNCTETLKSNISSYKVTENKENVLENESFGSNQLNENIICSKFDQSYDCKLKEFFAEQQKDKYSYHSCETSSDFLASSEPNSNYTCSSSPEVSSTTSEEKNSSILLKITNCNGSRVSQINEVSTDSPNKLSYKLTENREFRNYTSNFSSTRTLITKAAQKYIPPLKDTFYDLKVKLPLPQHRLHTLRQLKIAKVGPKADPILNDSTGKELKYDVHKKQKPKFEDVLKSIDEIHFRKRKDVRKGKNSIPKVIIKKNENGAHYASSKSVRRKEAYNPDLTGLKWQPWVFLEKNNFIDKMALQNKVKAIYCHRKHSYVLLDRFRKYKSVYNANFVISQPNSDAKGNLKYTIKLKHS